MASDSGAKVFNVPHLMSGLFGECRFVTHRARCDRHRYRCRPGYFPFRCAVRPKRPRTMTHVTICLQSSVTRRRGSDTFPLGLPSETAAHPP